MPRVIQSGEFFVVGGPVQPDRSCYIERAADDLLLRGLADQQFCYVLGPKATGKTSLMVRTLRALRAEGHLCAAVDLAQIGARGDGMEAGRWFYSIAHRIVRELRIKVDLQAWWQEKSVLVSEQRLADFFWEIVLANTTVPVTVFFDSVERALELPFSRELFVALASCYSGRATEPDFQRVNFAISGVAAPRMLDPGGTLPLFEQGLEVDPEDFSLEETYVLCAGFAADEPQAQAAMGRIYYWVKGQPYLTQKIARGVARHRGNVDDVDNVVRTQFLGSGAREEEPLLNHIGSLLTEGGPHRRRALVLLGKLGKGAPIVADPDSYAQEFLELAGITAVGDDDFVTFRNRLVKAVFTSRWVRAALPFDWRAAAAVAAGVAALIMLPIWYMQYFPRPYIETLTGITDDYTLALDTHDKLRRFPGFGATADSLLADIMVRRSEAAADFTEVRAADDVLRSLEGYQETADRLMGAYWLRRSEASLRAADRDAALVYADLAQVGMDPRSSQLTASLIDSDYAALQGSYRFDEDLSQWEISWGSREITAIDATQRAWRLRLDGAAEARYSEQITALQDVPLRRELGVDEPGSAGEFLFQIDLEHPAEEQLMLTLEAPSGASVSFGLPPGVGAARELRVTERSVLASLADEDRQGVWRLTLVDQKEGSIGTLRRWGLLFAEELRGWEDVPDRDLEIPDPLRTDESAVQLSADGQLGVARPSRLGAGGALTLWDLASGAAGGDLLVDSVPSYIALTRDAARLVTVAGTVMTIWDVATRSPVGRIATQAAFVLPPAIGVDGQYVAIAEQVDARNALYSLLRADDGALVASIEGVTGVRDWVLGPQARYLVLVGPARSVRLIDPRRGTTIAELDNDSGPLSVSAPTDDVLLAVDAAGDIFVWRPSELLRGEVSRRFVGTTADSGSISVSSDGSFIAYEAEHSHVVVRDLASDAVRFIARVERANGPVRSRLAPNGGRLVTASGRMLREWEIDSSLVVSAAREGISAMALDPTAQIVALGYRNGHLRIRTAAQLREGIDAQDDIEYIGHQGPVSALAVNSMRGLIASGGRDGIVRVWDLASGAPMAPFMRHSDGPIYAVAVGADGRYIASATEGSARVWSAADGKLVLETPVNGTALAVAISPDSAVLAAGDGAGNVFLTDLGDPASLRSGRAQAAVTSLAFSSDGGRLVSGDRSGRIQQWDPSSGTPLGSAFVLPQPIRWLGFSADGRSLVAQTDHWVHRLQVSGQDISIDATRLIGIDREAGAPWVTGSDSVRLVGGREIGDAEVEEVDWDADVAAAPNPDAALIGRQWPQILGLEIDDLGDITERRY